MKTHLSLLSVGLSAVAHLVHAESPTIPQRPPAEAFQKLTEDWPFALATPAAPVAEVVQGWASNFYVGGIGKNYESGKEEVFVAVKSKDGQASFSLFGNQPNADNISIGGIEWSERIGKSRVTLKKGSEFATIEFDQVALQTPAPQAPAVQRVGMPNPNLPGNRPPGVNIPRPTNIPQAVPQPVPLPGPSNTNAAPGAPPVPVNPVPNAGPRQRVRVINSTPQ